jgi:TonB-dependent receptor
MKKTPGPQIGNVVRAILGGAAAVPLLTSTALAATAASTTGPAASDQIEEVVVTGLRASLQKSLDIKKDADGVVDAISAEDVGKFPDSNLAAAMMRVPGVSVSRGTSAMGGVPTSLGDATQITVRGFGPQFNETLFDGRRVASGIGNRGFDFSSLSADGVNEVDVNKTPDATLSSGAIGATINIKYPKPFDHPGMNVASSLSTTHSPEDGKYTPNGHVQVSDTFADNTFGVLLSADISDRKVRGNHVNIQGWEGSHLSPSQLAGAAAGASTQATITDWFIQDYGIYQEHSDDKRVGGRLVLQAKPSDNIVLTLNDDYAKENLTQTQYGYSIWFNNGSLTNVTQDGNGTVTSFVQPNTPTDFQSQVNGSVLRSNDIGFNVKWAVSDKSSYEFDFANSQSKLNPNGELSSIDVDVGYGPSVGPSPANPLGGTNGTNVGIAGVGSSSLPYPTGIGPNGNAAAFINNGIIGSHVLPMSSPRNSDTINQFKLQGTWQEDKLTLKYGFAWLKDKEDLSEVDDFQNNDWQAYNGYGPASNNIDSSGALHGVALPQNLFTGSFGTSGFIKGFSNNGNLPAQILAFNPYAVLNYLQGLGNPQTTNIPGANVNCCNPAFNGIYQMAPNNGGFQALSEESFAAFVNFNTTMQIADMPLRVNVGVREERTNLSSQGLAALPNGLAVQSGDHTAFNVSYTPTTLVSNSNTYRYLLPNVDLNLSLTDQVKLRFDASRTLTRPPLNFLTPDLNVGQGQRVGALNATGGNPGLLPYLADNLDLGVEWYYARNSYFAVDGFVKDVTNFIINGTTTQTINGVVDPTTGQLGQFSVTTHINGPSAEVRGLEVALQHMFWDTGFGFQANATMVHTDRNYDASNLTVSGFAVTGLANSANLVAFYEKHGFQARVAVNWRDEYLDHFGQQQNNSAFGSEPTFVNANTQVDFSSSYDFNDHFSGYFEALNLTDATYSTHGRYKNQILDVVDFGRAFTLGFHYKY